MNSLSDQNLKRQLRLYKICYQIHSKQCNQYIYIKTTHNLPEKTERKQKTQKLHKLTSIFKTVPIMNKPKQYQSFLNNKKFDKIFFLNK